MCLMFSFFVSGEASLVQVFFFALIALPGLCTGCMHAVYVMPQISDLIEHTFAERASNWKARFLMDFLMVSLKVVRPSKTPSTKSTLHTPHFCCLLKSNEFTIKFFCKISSKHEVNVANQFLVCLQKQWKYMTTLREEIFAGINFRIIS